MDGEPVVRPDVSSSTQGVQALGETGGRGKSECDRTRGWPSSRSPRSLNLMRQGLGTRTSEPVGHVGSKVPRGNPEWTDLCLLGGGSPLASHGPRSGLS